MAPRILEGLLLEPERIRKLRRPSAGQSEAHGFRRQPDARLEVLRLVARYSWLGTRGSVLVARSSWLGTRSSWLGTVKRVAPVASARSRAWPFDSRASSV